MTLDIGLSIYLVLGFLFSVTSLGFNAEENDYEWKFDNLLYAVRYNSIGFWVIVMGWLILTVIYLIAMLLGIKPKSD